MYLAFSGKAKKIPSQYRLVELSKLLKCDYWTLMRQPNWFLELHENYETAKNMVLDEQNKKLERTSKKRHGGIRR